MTDDPISKATMTDDTDQPTAEDPADAPATDAPAEDATDTADTAADAPGTAAGVDTATRDSGWSGRTRERWLWVAALLVVAAITGGAVFGFVKFRGVTDELGALRAAQADRDTVAQLASDYATKSLTYSFEDPDAFFRSVQDGVSPALKDKYVNATDLLTGIMLQAQVTSTGEVLATDAVAQPGGVYQVVVAANQITRNLQNPEPRVSVMLLQVTVNKVDDTWQISDIGPKTGSRTAGFDELTPPAPKPGG